MKDLTLTPWPAGTPGAWLLGHLLSGHRGRAGGPLRLLFPMGIAQRPFREDPSYKLGLVSGPGVSMLQGKGIGFGTGVSQDQS